MASDRTPESTMSDRVMASWQEASRVGRLVWGGATKVGSTLNRIRIVATSPPAPIDDGWEVIDKEDFERPTKAQSRNKVDAAEPPRRPEPSRNPTVSKFHNSVSEMTEMDVVRRYRETERELRHAIKQGNVEVERQLRNELSKRRHDVWEKEQTLWTTTPIRGGQRTVKTTLPVFKNCQSGEGTTAASGRQQFPHPEETEQFREILNAESHAVTTHNEPLEEANRTTPKAPSDPTLGPHWMTQPSQQPAADEQDDDSPQSLEGLEDPKMETEKETAGKDAMKEETAVVAER